MAIVVAYKFAANPQDAGVAADGRVDWSRAKEAISDYDPVAITVARRTAAADGTELVGITVGGAASGTPNARKGALARGLDRSLVVADDATRAWNATTVASALAALVGRVDGADCVLTGDASVDEGAQVVPALIAGHLGWPCFLDVRSIDRVDNRWELMQTHRGGTRHVTVAGPVVISVATDAAEVKSPGMKDILAAGKKPSETVAIADLPLVEAPLDVTGHAPAPMKERRHQIFEGDDAAGQLVSALRSAGVL